MNYNIVNIKNMLKIEVGTENKTLRKISEKVKDSEIKKYVKLWKEMVKYIKNPKNWWVWLAAPQVWYNIRLIAVGLPNSRDDENYKTIFMFNPVVLDFSEEKEYDEEWCLSVPNIKWVVGRSKNIKLVYQDEKWAIKSLILKWLKARVVQHEIDHLDWILFVDKMEK